MRHTLKSFIDSTFPSDFSENPEMYLGPNYRTVLNFYTLACNGMLRRIAAPWPVDDRYDLFLNELVLKIIPNDIKRSLPYPLPVFELITMHLLFERGETLKFVPLFTIKDDHNGF
jgi:hypothetical protein